MVTEIERARSAIGSDDAAADWQLNPERHSLGLPLEAGPLHRVLEQPHLKQIVAKFRDADAAAVAAQTRYKRIGRAGLYAATIATLVGSVFLLPLEAWLSGWERGLASVVQISSLVVAFVAARLLAVAKPFNTWMNKRAEAEIARVELFNAILQADEKSGPGELPLLPLKLEYFRRYQLDVQRRYYRGRGEQHAASLWRNNRWLSLSLLLTVVSVVLAALAGLQVAAAFGVPLPSPLVGLFSNVPAGHINRIVLALGVMGSALYGLGVARSLMDLDERNASRYLTTAQNLDFVNAELPDARTAANDNDAESVLAFVDRVQTLISAEHREWILLSSIERGPIARARFLRRKGMSVETKALRPGLHDGVRQQENDAEYRRRILSSEGDVPPTLGSAVPTPEPATTRPPLSSEQGLVADALNARVSAQEMAAALALRRPQTPQADFPANAPGNSHAARGPNVLVIAALAALAAVPLFSRTVREAFYQSWHDAMAALGFRLETFSFFGMLKGTNRTAATKPATAVRTDPVDCSVFAPNAAPPGSTVMVQVFLHIPEHFERAKFSAAMMDETAVPKGVRTLEIPIVRGAAVGIALDAPGVQVEEPTQTVYWRGEPVFAQFLVTLPEHESRDALFLKVRVSVNGGLVGYIAFRMVVEAGAPSGRSMPSGERAQRYNKAFLSYATQDRKEVLKRAQVLRAAGVDFFQDVLSLNPGDRWEKEVYRHIDSCDLFLLFWSQAAKESEWVIKETEYALRRQVDGVAPDVIPVILEGPPSVSPPESLAHIHFNDRISYLAAAT